MGRPAKGVWFSTAAVLLFIAVMIFLAVKPSTQAPEPTSAFTVGLSAQVPPAVGTYDLLPTLTPRPTEPTWTPSPIPPPPAVSTRPPVSGHLPNLAWGTTTDNSFTLWAGRYSDSPTPALASAKALAHWNIPLTIMSMAASPDGRYLALLTIERCIPPTPMPTATPEYVNGTPMPVYPHTEEHCMGDFPRYLYVVDLVTTEVRTIPNYSDRELYAEHGPYFSHNNEVMGWFDNDRIALDAGQLLVATKDGSSFQYRNFPNLTGRDNYFEIQLLSDRKTMFVWVNQEFYLRDADTGVIRKVGNWYKGAWYDHVKASPNGQYISYLAPEVGRQGMDYRHVSLSFQRFPDDARHLIMSSGVWDRRPAWSPDSSRIAFARTKSVPRGYASIFNSEKADTDIYIATVTDLKVRQLTSFTGVHNRNIQWTPGGYLLVASSFGSSNETFGFVVVSTTDGTARRLWGPPPGETIVGPALFEL